MSNQALIEAYCEALNLKLEPEFILILKKELASRQLSITKEMTHATQVSI
jgi:hypothetical protein